MWQCILLSIITSTICSFREPLCIGSLIEIWIDCTSISSLAIASDLSLKSLVSTLLNVYRTFFLCFCSICLMKYCFRNNYIFRNGYFCWAILLHKKQNGYSRAYYPFLKLLTFIFMYFDILHVFERWRIFAFWSKNLELFI